MAGLYVANGALSASAGRDGNLVSARLIANGDINLPVQQSTLESSHASRGNSTFWESASGSGVHSETTNYNSSISAMPAR